VWLSACLFARISQNNMSKLHKNFLYMLPVAVGRLSPDDNGISYVLPALWMTSYLPITGYMSRGYVKRAYSQNDSPEGITDFSVVV